MHKTLKYLQEIVEANKEKKEVFYLARALDNNSNQTDIRTIIKRINEKISSEKLDFHIQYYDFLKVKIIIDEVN